MTRHMTIGKKLLGAFAVMLATAVALSLGAFWQVRSLTAELTNAVHVTARKQFLAGAIENSVAQMTASEQSLLIGAILQRPAAVTQAKEAFRKQMAFTQTTMNEYQALLESGDAGEALNALRQGLALVTRAHDEMLGDLDKGQFDLVQKISDESVLPRENDADAEAGNRPSNGCRHAHHALTARLPLPTG